jgi:UDP-N-acetylmuramate dehydrogenase
VGSLKTGLAWGASSIIKAMPKREQAPWKFTAIRGLNVREQAPLSQYTRFGIGGPAAILVDAPEEAGFLAALRVARGSGLPYVVLGGGSNLIVSDEGYAGIVLRYTGARIEARGTAVHVEAGAVLQDLIDFTIAHGLRGLETMAGIPGWVGAAVYGNAGAYGHSIAESVEQVRFFDGSEVRVFGNAECQFRYRESVFKAHKDWTIFSADLALTPASAEELRGTADHIVRVRNEKFPPSMKCAGSIFKNLLQAELPTVVADRVPERVIREGKVPAAFFLEQVGAKGMRHGGIRIADYHANLIYNEGGGTARELRELIHDVKSRVWDEFRLELEEEVQYVGFEGIPAEAAAPPA